ncbi:ribosomal protein L15 [Sphingobium xanthum]|nr:ribosomal protein L15 [Sphingobium sp. B12D2B]MCW2364362.1 ribosomal protein L15 [Sphingobium sp. B10D3B]MCW2368838.1 ribosomal protein L15 [Sphingobium sp. B11D3D]MCW2402241.1 ribosomal protein L15 [Sphingobium sp. B10D7B]MCW2409220.1 ribosomal protein L15 [Sphingobium xanthum]
MNKGQVSATIRAVNVGYAGASTRLIKHVPMIGFRESEDIRRARLKGDRVPELRTRK